jgi:hypothetical protein
MIDIMLSPARTITTKSRAPNVFVADLFNTKLNPPDNNEIDDTTNNNKPIPFLIRNTTAQGMPISIGALRPVNSGPKFQSFNSFIKRLPPPQKYVFETRQVLAGDVVDPYNYLRALFRGEVTSLLYFLLRRARGMQTNCGKWDNAMRMHTPSGAPRNCPYWTVTIISYHAGYPDL